MSPQLSKRLVIGLDVLERLVATRLKEAESLLQRKFFSGAVYLAGYAVECQLKARICRTLELARLPETFKTHDLELLLLHSGVRLRLDSDPEVARSFRKICGFWRPGMDLRYSDPDQLPEKDATLFMEWVAGPEVGVVPWLQKVI